MAYVRGFRLALHVIPCTAFTSSFPVRGHSRAVRSALYGVTTYQEDPVPDMLGKFQVSVAKHIGGRATSATSATMAMGGSAKMEDEAFVAKDFACVLDGHGGGQVSKYVLENLYSELMMALATTVGSPFNSVKEIDDDSLKGVYDKASDEDYETALRSALATINTHCFGVEEWGLTGTTVCACWIVPSGDDTHKILFCNIGDSRGMLFTDGECVFCTKDHKPNDPVEQARIEAAGGSVYEKGGTWRVVGGLAMSRAIGDWKDSPFVGAEPDITTLPISPELPMQVVLATDGLWDVVKDFPPKIVAEILTMGNASTLVRYSLLAKTEDNVAVIVIESAIPNHNS